MNTLFKPAILSGVFLCFFHASAFAGGAGASSNVSANIGLTTDYVWRGISQNNNDPAISFGLDLAAPNGFYAGTWASNVENTGDETEFDFYLGYAKEATKKTIGYDLGVINYNYPSLTADFTEAYVKLLFLNNKVEVGFAGIIDADDLNTVGDTYQHVTVNSKVKKFDVTTTIGNTHADDHYAHLRNDISYDIPNKAGTLTLSNDFIENNGSTNDSIVSLSWSKEIDL